MQVEHLQPGVPAMAWKLRDARQNGPCSLSQISPICKKYHDKEIKEASDSRSLLPSLGSAWIRHESDKDVRGLGPQNRITRVLRGASGEILRAQGALPPRLANQMR